MATARRVVKRFLRAVTNTYFSRIQVRGRKNLPADPRAGCIFAGNHPSGLLDPLVIMAAIPDHDVTSVAKSPLFTAPVVGWFLRVMRAVPVAHATTVCTPAERKAMNEEMFDTTPVAVPRNT